MKLDLPAVAAALTTVPSLDGDAALRTAVADQADRQAIADLCVLYARAVDEYDLEAVVDCYTPDGVFVRRGLDVVGADAIRDAYRGAFTMYRTMLHTPHPGFVHLQGADDQGRRIASGWSHGHAELATRSTLVLASFRYEDDYRRTDGRWRFARRSITFMYAVPADRMAGSFTDVNRIRWPGAEPEPADYPETGPHWGEHQGTGHQK